MIRFETSRFGTLEVEDNKIINFHDGLLGFSHLKRYILMDYKDTPLKWLQAVDDPEIAFIVVEPRIFFPDYSIKLDNAIKHHLQIENDEDLAVLVIIRVEGEKMIANLHGPILLNASLMRGVQVVLEKA